MQLSSLGSYVRVLCLLVWGSAALLPALQAGDGGSGFLYDYELGAQTLRGNESRKADLKVQLYRTLNDEGDLLTIALMVGGDEKVPAYFPLGALVTDGEGITGTELEREESAEIVSKFISQLVGIRIPKDRLKNPTEGDEKIELSSAASYKAIPVHYKSTLVEGKPGRWNYGLKLSGEPSRPLGSMVVILKTLEVNYFFDEGEELPAEGTWVQLEQRSTGSSVERRMQFKQTGKRALAEGEEKSVSTEFEALRTVLDTLDSGSMESTKEAEQQLKSFRDKHKQSALAPVVTGLQSLIARKKLLQQKIADPLSSVKKLLGQSAPDFTLKDTQGKDVTLSAQKGNVVLVTFWGLGCKGCRLEAPSLTRLFQENKDKPLKILAVNAYNESLDEINRFVKSAALEHTILLDGNAVAWESYSIDDYPANFVIDREGKIVWFRIGWEGESSLRLLEEELQKNLGSH